MKDNPYSLINTSPPSPEDCFHLNKQCRPLVNTTLCGISLGYSLFAKGPVYRIQNEKGIATHAYLKNDIAVQMYLIDCPSKRL